MWFIVCDDCIGVCSDVLVVLYIGSGDPDVETSKVSESVFIHSGENPYELISDSIKYVLFQDIKIDAADLPWYFFVTFEEKVIVTLFLTLM